jgi:hypothetical protein
VTSDEKSTHGEGPAPPDVDGSNDAMAAVIAEVRGIRDHLESLVRLEVDRAKLRLRAKLIVFLWVGFLAIVLLTATVTAVIHAVAGTNAALAELIGGPEWAGKLAGAALLVGLVALGLVVIEVVLRRRSLARMKRTYEPSSSRASNRGQGP